MGKDSKTFTQLVKRATGGDPEAINALCAAKARNILYVCTSLAGNQHDGEDLSQEVCIQLMQNIGKLKNVASFNSWLYRIIRGEYANMVRKHCKERVVSIDQLALSLTDALTGEGPESYLEDEEIFLMIEQMLDKLPVRNKLCVLMFYYEGMSYAEIARAMDISKKDVDYLLQRSRLLMRRTLEAEEAPARLLHHFPAMVSFPVLSAFSRQQAAVLSSTSVEAVVHEALACAALPTLGGAGAGAGAAVAVKVTAATAALALGAATGYAAIASPQGTAAMPISATSYPAAYSVQSTAEAVAPATSLPVESLLEIHTLEDLLGAEAATLLEQLAAATPPDYEEFQALLLATGLTYRQQLGAEDGSETYTLYTLTRQDKQLMLISLQSEPGALQGLAYHFTGAEEGLPRQAELLYRFTDWCM